MPGAVLIVEDDQAVAAAVRAVLEDEGHPVWEATNGREALDLLAKMPRPCVILLDMMMPVMTGWEFLTEVRHNGTVASIPIVVTSAVAERAVEGARALVRKPYSLEELLSVVERFCPIGRTVGLMPPAAGKALAARSDGPSSPLGSHE